VLAATGGQALCASSTEQACRCRCLPAPLRSGWDGDAWRDSTAGYHVRCLFQLLPSRKPALLRSWRTEGSYSCPYSPLLPLYFYSLLYYPRSGNAYGAIRWRGRYGCAWTRSRSSARSPAVANGMTCLRYSHFASTCSPHMAALARRGGLAAGIRRFSHTGASGASTFMAEDDLLLRSAFWLLPLAAGGLRAACPHGSFL